MRDSLSRIPRSASPNGDTVTRYIAPAAAAVTASAK